MMTNRSRRELYAFASVALASGVTECAADRTDAGKRGTDRTDGAAADTAGSSGTEGGSDRDDR